MTRKTVGAPGSRQTFSFETHNIVQNINRRYTGALKIVFSAHWTEETIFGALA